MTEGRPASRLPIALTIAGSDPSGGAGIQADLKAFTVLGVYGASVITALTAQSTRGVDGIFPVPAHFVARQIASVAGDLRVGAVKTGMLNDANTVRAVAEALRKSAMKPLVVDPVMVATSGDLLMAEGMVAALRETLLPLADLLTPNLPEAARLLECPPAADEAEMEAQARALVALGCKAVVVKGGHGQGAEAVDILVERGGQTLRLALPRVDTRNTHGTGCTFSAAIAAHLAQGQPLAAAVAAAKREVVVPPGAAPGAVDVVVFNDLGFVTAAGGFRYSEPPTISAVDPETLRYDEGGTVTVTGSGFLDENAGVLSVTVDGEPAVDVEVVSDTQLTFLGPPGGIFTRADIVVENDRGVATTEEGFVYGPGPQGGILLWPKFNSAVYVMFYDPLTLELQKVPRKEPVHIGGFRTVVKNAAGTYLGIDHEDNKLYSIDIVEQTQTEVAAPTTRIVELARVGSTFYAISKPSQSCCDTRSFGTFDVSNGAFSAIGSGNIASSGRYGLAPDGAGTMFVTELVPVPPDPSIEVVKTINRASGAPGSPITMSTAAQISGMRFLGSTLYGITRNGELFTINTTTGATDLQLSSQATQTGLQAIEVVP